jgi:hypothetical protein
MAVTIADIIPALAVLGGLLALRYRIDHPSVGRPIQSRFESRVSAPGEQPARRSTDSR